MELTPIRVRGKRRHAGGEQRRVALRPKPPDRDLRRKKQKKRLGARPKPRASDLEKSLPLEVVERIFWLSENVNFPRASLRLGRLLSSPSTLRKTFLSAFEPTWEAWFGRLPGQVAGVEPEGDAGPFVGNASFQTDLLACSWTTIQLILDCRDMWVRRRARDRSFEYVPLWGDPLHSSPCTGSGATIGISNIKEARYYFYHDYYAFRNVECLGASYWGAEYRKEDDPITWIDINKSTVIPDDLITGPWDDGSLQKLFWLIQAGARLSPSQTWELTREGFCNALSNQNAPNLTVMRILNILGAFQDWPVHVRQEEFYKVDAIMDILREDNVTDLHAKYAYVEWLLTKDK
ncbi:hypothetical protein ONZ43_g2067 [Nemania bipapillata]|uniref:Uncharacterized protein n=1 Tax=Nemania bipapillata TaxID=110536 RepID=A0ACC2J2D8_9PEZI|nr:hypothetical protein ONZ43_g2067 [Nemania bipapillata]